MSRFTFEEFQARQAKWVNKQPFGCGPAYHPLLGIVEEVGELCHAYLKDEQNIRGEKEDHIEEAKDAVGDIVMYLADFCTRMGFDFSNCVRSVLEDVEKRDWNKNSKDGKHG